MLKFVSLAVKLQLDVHDLNNETVAGNVNDIRVIQFVDEKGQPQEEPAVSGRMLKHWHYEAMRQLILNGPYDTIKLCDACKAGEPTRPATLNEGKWDQIISEESAVKGCGICDIHGYLIAKKAQKDEEEKDEGGISARRSSRAMFSWLMPVLGTETVSKQVIHNRVSSDPSVMMPFNKSYASGIYGFVSVLDIDRIGIMESRLGKEKQNIIQDEDRKSRIKAAIEAYRYLISGQMGASLSHAIPHTRPIEILAAFSEKGPLPFPVSPIYSDYLSTTVGLTPDDATLLYWGSSENSRVSKKNDIKDIFSELLNKV